MQIEFCLVIPLRPECRSLALRVTTTQNADVLVLSDVLAQVVHHPTYC